MSLYRKSHPATISQSRYRRSQHVAEIQQLQSNSPNPGHVRYQFRGRVGCLDGQGRWYTQTKFRVVVASVYRVRKDLEDDFVSLSELDHEVKEEGRPTVRLTGGF